MKRGEYAEGSNVELQCVKFETEGMEVSID